LGSEPAYAVRRSSRARRARLTITRHGDAVVVLPMTAPESIAAGLVASHRGWLERHQLRILGERSALAARPGLDDGRLLPLRGIGHQVVRQAMSIGRRPVVAPLPGNPPRLSVGLPRGREAEAADVLERWLRAEARRELSAAVTRRAAEMGLAVGRISVRDQRTRWASASARGDLSFSWRLVLCPPDVLDYVVVHELAHLRWRGHGPRFWALVRRYAPDADRHRRWLREHRGQLAAALD
jgi:predicted metal-dependent hydrolase